MPVETGAFVPTGVVEHEVDLLGHRTIRVNVPKPENTAILQRPN